MNRGVLIVLSGLPRVGKTTLARAVARRLPAAHLRVDTFEARLAHLRGEPELTQEWEFVAGYALAAAAAADQLAVGLHAVADSVNPRPVTRDMWAETARKAGADLLEVEVVCTDRDEHRRRVQERTTDEPGLTLPGWEAVVGREYRAWERPVLRIDTAATDPEAAAARIVEEVWELGG